MPPKTLLTGGSSQTQGWDALSRLDQPARQLDYDRITDDPKPGGHSLVKRSNKVNDGTCTYNIEGPGWVMLGEHEHSEDDRREAERAGAGQIMDQDRQGEDHHAGTRSHQRHPGPL